MMKPSRHMLVLPVVVTMDGLPLKEKSIDILLLLLCDNLTFLWQFFNEGYRITWYPEKHGFWKILAQSRNLDI